mgnify:CR=1 FL=1
MCAIGGYVGGRGLGVVVAVSLGIREMEKECGGVVWLMIGIDG